MSGVTARRAFALLAGGATAGGLWLQQRQLELKCDAHGRRG